MSSWQECPGQECPGQEFLLDVLQQRSASPIAMGDDDWRYEDQGTEGGLGLALLIIGISLCFCTIMLGAVCYWYRWRQAMSGDPDAVLGWGWGDEPRPPPHVVHVVTLGFEDQDGRPGSVLGLRPQPAVGVPMTGAPPPAYQEDGSLPPIREQRPTMGPPTEDIVVEGCPWVGNDPGTMAQREMVLAEMRALGQLPPQGPRPGMEIIMLGRPQSPAPAAEEQTQPARPSSNAE